MKKHLATVLAILLGAMLMTGCGQSEEPEPEEPAEVLYPVSVNGTEIRVGETTVQALLDQGITVTVSEMGTDVTDITTYEVDPETELEPNSYYSGASIWISDSIFAHISMATDEETVKLGEATIARLEFSMVSATPEERSVIEFNGVPVSEISEEKANEMFPDFTSYDGGMLLYGLDYSYSLSFSPEDDMLYQFSVEKEYDVDWNNEEQ